MDKSKIAGIGEAMVKWFDEPENYSVVQFAADHRMSKEELFEMAAEDEEFRKALEYAFTVQEFKLADGAMSGAIDRTVALKMLETYNGWKNALDWRVGGTDGGAIKLSWVIEGAALARGEVLAASSSEVVGEANGHPAEAA
jgi:hypothetical protein